MSRCHVDGQVRWTLGINLNEAQKVKTLAWSIDLTESATMGILRGPARQSQSCQHNPPTRVVKKRHGLHKNSRVNYNLSTYSLTELSYLYVV